MPTKTQIPRRGFHRLFPMSALALATSIAIAIPTAADPARGEKLWRKCVSCHTLDVNGRNKVGPRLHGLFGRAAGSVIDYRYSDALKGSGIIWNERTLDAFLKDTEGFMPGTKMYGGLSQDEDRANLIQFLKRATSDGTR
jgi:cytochrome c